MDNNYNPHNLEWTDEKVSRFWNFYNNYAPYSGTWFTEEVGKEILKFVNKKATIKGKILDYGTGKGFLLQHLSDNYSNIELYACDFTDTVAKETGNKFKNLGSFKGCLHITRLPSPYQENFFDFVFLIETIEHLTDNYLHATLKEIQRILKPGGYIVITTPNNEMIEKNYVHCADCGATFHHMQHVRSWDVQKLSKLAGEFGFGNICCKAINLKWYKKNGLLHVLFDKMKNIIGSGNTENLVYIGKK
jgi:ubiquinone/menaquinone biosynthesis C-methylase UbiE